jgi:hypothetical protein
MYTQNQWLLSNLLEFYQNQEYLETLKQIINREYVISHNSKKLSIRLVNWFVTNYAKQYFTAYEIPIENDESKRFFVWTNYKSTEDSYSKQMFDPYCRKSRVLIPYKNDTSIETTVGQLHFFKWAIVNKVIEYIIDHYDVIEKDMNVRLNTVKRKPAIDNDGTKTRKKREELSENACKTMRKETCSIKMTF